MEDAGSGPSNILSSAPSDLLTSTIESNISQNRSSSNSRSHQLRNSSLVPPFANDIPVAYLAIPPSFLPRKKARKGHCWFPANGIEVLDKGKWRWKCARCMLFLESTSLRLSTRKIKKKNNTLR